MSLSNHEFLKIYFKGKSKKQKNLSFRFVDNVMFMGNIEILIKMDKLLLVNETANELYVGTMRELAVKIAKVYGYTPIRIPFKIGEEKTPEIAEIRTRLRNRLEYYYNHQEELLKQSNREQYMAYFDEFRTFLYRTTRAKVNRPLRALYEQLNDKEYCKKLKLLVARHKALQK